MSDPQSKSKKIPLVSIVVFLVVQSTVLMTWAPMGRGDLNPYLTAVGVVPLHVPFGDFRTISAGIQFHEQGSDPYVDGNYDFMGRKFNYPPIWLSMSFLGLSPEGVSYVYFAFATLFSLALMLLFWSDGNRAWYFYFFFIFSPPVLLALERCNNDLLMFFLIVFGLWVGRNSIGKMHNWISGLLLLGATILKVFPVFAFYIFLRKSWRNSLLFLVPFGVLCGVYFVSIKPTLDLIHENTPWSVYLSFGVNVIPNYLSEKLPESAFFQGPFSLGIAWLLACIGIVGGYRLGKRAMMAGDLDGYDATLFRAGSGIFIAVFLMGSNYDYRLMFLLLTLPFAFRMLSQEQSQRRWIVSYLVTMFVAFWINEASSHHWSNGSLMEVGLLVNELATWMLFFMLVIAQFRMLPQFVRQMLYRVEAVS